MVSCALIAKGLFRILLLDVYKRQDLASSSEEGFSSLNAVGSGESVSSDGALKEPAETDSYDGRDDLEGPVPMAGMQRIIFAVVVVCLVAFIVYFAVMHG